MSVLKKRLLISFVVLFALFRFSLLFTDTGIWPFWNYAMFAGSIGDEFPLISVKLTQDNGASTEVLTNKIYPIEVFRTFPLNTAVFFGKSSVDKAKFLKMVLYHINEKPWWGFDVIKAPPQPQLGHKFIKIEVYKDLYNYKKFKNIRSFSPIKRELVASYIDEKY